MARPQHHRYKAQFIYLDNLQSVGTTPECYRASVQASFDVNKREATRIVRLWMKYQLQDRFYNHG